MTGTGTGTGAASKRPNGGTLPGLLAARLAADPASPLVTFYDDATGERTELSAATFANWVAKTANLLVDGLGTSAGEHAAVALPVHWQSLVVTAACWSAGLSVDLAAAPGGRVAFAAERGRRPEAEEVVLLSLRPMGAALASADRGVFDYAADVLTYGDRYAGPAPTADSVALPGVTHRELVAEGDAFPYPGRRMLLAPSDDPPLDRGLLLSAYLGPLASGGSIVLVRNPDQSKLVRLAEAERATAYA